VKQVTVPVTYVSQGDQEIILALQLDADPFTLYTQATTSRDGRLWYGGHHA
jgi:hypothetical protein